MKPKEGDMIARIEGYASIFNTPDLNGDVVSPGAFTKALREKGAREIRMLYQHAAETPIGRWTRFREDARGLYAEGELILSSNAAREVYALLKGRAIDGLSIGFQTVRAAKHERSAKRFIHEADLWEVSIVTFPMAPGARIAFVGEAEDPSISAAQPGGSPFAGGRAFADGLRAAAEILSV